jgi:hypothetical protein
MKTIERKSDWPKWANYYAQDQNGYVYVYKHVPMKDTDKGVWINMGGGPISLHLRRIDMNMCINGNDEPKFCEGWESTLCEVVPEVRIASVVLDVHAITQLHNVPSILRKIAAQVECEGCGWSKANGSGTSWDWKVSERDSKETEGGDK